MPDLNANDLDAATKIVAGTARSMGVDRGGTELMARGKRYRQAYDQIDRTKAYEPAEAVALIKGAPGAKFDETVELHIRLGRQRPPRRGAAARHPRPARAAWART